VNSVYDVPQRGSTECYKSQTEVGATKERTTPPHVASFRCGRGPRSPGKTNDHHRTSLVFS